MWCWSGGRGILRKLSLCYSIVSYYNGAQWYEQVGRLYRGLILLGFALFHPSTICIEIFLVTFFSFPISEPLTWLNNQCPLVLWHCWLGHLTLKIVSEMTCNVSSETLNRTIPYHTCILAWFLWAMTAQTQHISITLFCLPPIQPPACRIPIRQSVSGHCHKLQTKPPWITSSENETTL